VEKLFVEDLELREKRVLMRVDFNVPLQNREVADDNRIRAALPTIEYVLNRGGRLILMSHLGRPKGQHVPELSLQPCVEALARLLKKPVAFSGNCIGEAVESEANQLEAGEVLLLENLRYHKAETDNNDAFAAQLARLGDVYVNDAFGTVHRAHASTSGVTRHITECAAGYLLMKEITFLGKALEAPRRPFVAILGGAKISGKIDVIANLLPKVDHLIVGGAMAFTFFKALGMGIGKSLLEADKIDVAKALLADGKNKIVLPTDCVVAEAFDIASQSTGPLQTVSCTAIPQGAAGLDIGAGSVERFAALIKTAQTIVWNGPMGVFEIPQTAAGTTSIAKLMAAATRTGATTIIGGGDSAAAVARAGVADQVSHVSTGGGASLAFLEGKSLPGIDALTDK
jgi:phosphoglycerate kinase